MPADSYMAAIAKRGYLVAGVDQNTFLWGYRDPTSNQLEGFDIDMVDRVAEAIFGPTWSSHIHYVIVPNAERARAVQDGEVDIVAETMTITCQREQEVDFSAEYYAANQEILVPKGSVIDSEASLGGKRVCTAQGSTSLTKLAALRPRPVLWSVTNQTDCLVMLQQGQVDAISTDDTILDGLAAQDPNLEILPGIKLEPEPYGMAISKAHPDFVSFVNAVLAQEETDGKWTTSWEHWLGRDFPDQAAPSPPRPVYRGS
jgi:polar amino acid transport system substrate-binding protein